MQKVSIAHFYSAIDVLYHSQAIEGKDEASKWLEQFQKSVHAWEISDQILQQRRDQEAVYLAAQTMKTKVQLHFAELPKEQHLALKDSLIKHLKQYSMASHPTITQLCLAVGLMAIQSPQWTSPINELVQTFSTKVEDFSILLEVLMIIPEEIENENLQIGTNRRNEVYETLRLSSETVFHLLTSCREICPREERAQCKLYQSFGSWMALGCFPPDKVAQSSLLKGAFQALLDPNTSKTLHEAITDCICNALYTASDIENQRILSEACFSFVSSTLPPAFEASVKREDLDSAINYGRIFTEMGEAFLNQIVTTPGHGAGDLKTLDLVLKLAQHPNYEVSEISFNFWYNLSEYASENMTVDRYSIFRPYIEQLILSLCERCEFDDSHEGVPEKGDEFQEYRLRVLDVIHDVAFIIGSAECFNQIFSSIHNKNLPWNKLESRIFAMNPLTKFIPPSEQAPGYLLEMVFQLPADIHLTVRHTCVVIIGDLSTWISEHDQVIERAFQYLLNGLQHKNLAQMSAHALSKLCERCSQKMSQMFPVLLQVSEASDKLSVDNEGIISILAGCALVLSHLSTDDVSNGLMKLCTPHVQPLYEICKGSSNNDPVKYLDRLASVFRNTHVSTQQGVPHPCKKVIEQLWDLFKMVIQKFKTDEKIMERHFRCLRFGIRCIGPDFMHLMDPFVQLIVPLYREHQHSCLLYIGSVLVDEYGLDTRVQPSLLQLFKDLVAPTFTILSKEQGLFHHPDTVDDFFRLCIRFLQKITLVFLKDETINSTMQLAVAGISLNHRDANQSVMKFYQELIKCTQLEQDNPLRDETNERIKTVEHLLEQYGQNIVIELVNATAGGIHVYMLPEVADVVWDMLQFCQRPMCMWFKEALSRLPSHNGSGAINATPQQTSDFYDLVSGAAHVRDLYKGFREYSRFFK